MVYPEPYRIHDRPPTVTELRELHAAAGWADLPEDDDALARGLAASLFGVVVTMGADLVACARVVGDGGLYFYVQDVVVTPAHQGKGVGEIVMHEVMAYLAEHAAPGAFVGLMAAEDKASFYARYGFSARPAGAPGMALVWRPQTP